MTVLHAPPLWNDWYRNFSAYQRSSRLTLFVFPDILKVFRERVAYTHRMHHNQLRGHQIEDLIMRRTVRPTSSLVGCRVIRPHTKKQTLISCPVA